MPRIVLIYCLLVMLACNHDCRIESWHVMEISGDNPFLTDFTELRIDENKIEFLTAENSQEFPVYISGDKMIIKTSMEKMLIRIEYDGDSLLILRELYSNDPFFVKLRKIK